MNNNNIITALVAVTACVVLYFLTKFALTLITHHLGLIAGVIAVVVALVLFFAAIGSRK